LEQSIGRRGISRRSVVHGEIEIRGAPVRMPDKVERVSSFEDEHGFQCPGRRYGIEDRILCEPQPGILN
jgi:hypothetical protein